MNTRDYEDVIEGLLKTYCLFLVETVYVENVAEWCSKNGYEEPDGKKPMSLLASDERGCKLLIMEDIPESTVNDRIKAMSVRGALQSVAEDRAAMLDSDKKKLAFLFLSEYASTLPELEDDELLADNWAFGELTRLGFFRE